MQLNLRTSLKVSTLASTFSELVSLSFLCQMENIDDTNMVQWVKGRSSNSYHLSLQRLAARFLKVVNTFCLSSEVSCARRIEKPNIHRLLELVYHTVPQSHHAKFVAEMVLDSFHQQFKSTLTRNSSKIAHVSAMYMCLSNDWFTRLSEILPLDNEGYNTEFKERYMKGMLCIFFGRCYGIIYDDKSWAGNIRSQLKKLVTESTGGIFQRILSK